MTRTERAEGQRLLTATGLSSRRKHDQMDAENGVVDSSDDLDVDLDEAQAETKIQDAVDPREQLW